MMEAQPIPLDRNQNRASIVLAVYWVPYPILVILIAARMFVRVKIRHLGLDDWFMFLAWVRVIEYASPNVLTTSKITISVTDSLISYYLVRGGARHSHLTPGQITLMMKYSVQPLGIISVVLGKTSVALLLLRIVGLVSTWRKRFIYGNLLLYWTTTVVMIVVGFVRCSPTRAIREPVPGSTCRKLIVLVSLSIFQSGKESLRVTQKGQLLTNL